MSAVARGILLAKLSVALSLALVVYFTALLISDVNLLNNLDCIFDGGVVDRGIIYSKCIFNVNYYLQFISMAVQSEV